MNFYAPLYNMSATQQPKRGGKKAKKFKKHPVVQGTKDVPIKDDGQEYATVTKVLGSGRYTALCYDGTTRLAHKRGALTRGPNKAIIAQGDLLLVSLREYQDAKCDIIGKYSCEHVRELVRLAELPTTYTVVERTVGADDDDNMPFDFSGI